MALNIAMPLSGVSDFLEGFGLLSPISVDCREHLKLLVSPIDSESSGISSLDSEELKEKTPIKIEEDCKIYYNGKNILDLASTLNDKTMWNIMYTELPENNFKMFLENRSQYHRLGTNGHIQEYSLNKCQCCDFQYPVNNYSYNLSGAAVNSSTPQLLPPPQQQQKLLPQPPTKTINNNNNNNASINYNNYINNNNNNNNMMAIVKKNDKNNNNYNYNNFNNNINNNNNNQYGLYRQF